MTNDDVYKIFAKFVVKNPTADCRAILRHVIPASGGFGDPDMISLWYSQWVMIRAELAL